MKRDRRDAETPSRDRPRARLIAMESLLTREAVSADPLSEATQADLDAAVRQTKRGRQ